MRPGERTRFTALACIACAILLFDAHTASAQRAGPTLVFGGDVIYDAPLAYQLRQRAPEVGRDEALHEIFTDLGPRLSRADLAVVNLEVPISPRYRERDERAVFTAPVDFLDALIAAGVDAVTVANNHAFDQGIQGLENTLSATDERSIAAIGAGATREDAARALILRAGNARVAIAAWTEGVNHRPTHEEMLNGPHIAFVRDGTIAASLRQARSEADLVIAMFHWTQEDLVVPRPVMRALAREAAEAGADVVIGHGTHVPGQRETVHTTDGREVPVLYSLGNLVAAMEEPAGTLLSDDVGVRDAPLVQMSTEWVQGHLRISRITVDHHWIADPEGRMPWVEGGRLAVLRPVAIEAELRRLDRAGCGEPCEVRAEAYRRRIALIDRAMANVDERVRPIAIAEAPRAPRSPAVPRERVRAPVAEVAPPSPALRHARERTLTTVAAPQEPPRAPVIADSDPRLAPYLRGVVLPATFEPGGVTEQTLDEAAMTRLVAIMQEDRGLRASVVGYEPVPDESQHPGLGSRRARRIRGLIAMRGPSRSRFESRGGTPGGGPRPGTSHIVVRLSR